MKLAKHTVLIVILLVGGLSFRPRQGYAQRGQGALEGARPTVPSFKVVGKDSAALSIVVPADITEAQLVALINGFRVARANGTLAKLIPPTTPNGSRGPYAAVEVFVFTDEVWATSARLRAFRNPQTSGISASEKAVGANIRGYYLHPLTGAEFGSIGYEDQGYKYTAIYKKLF